MENLSFSLGRVSKGRKRRRDTVSLRDDIVDGKCGDDCNNEEQRDSGVEEPETTSVDIIVVGAARCQNDFALDDRAAKPVPSTHNAVDVSENQHSTADTSSETERDSANSKTSQIARLIQRRRAERISGDDEAAYKADMQRCPDMSNRDEYKRVPVDTFGKALLQSMGWDGSFDEKEAAEREIRPRPHLRGLGASEPSEQRKRVRTTEENTTRLARQKGIAMSESDSVSDIHDKTLFSGSRSRSDAPTAHTRSKNVRADLLKQQKYPLCARPERDSRRTVRAPTRCANNGVVDENHAHRFRDDDRHSIEEDAFHSMDERQRPRATHSTGHRRHDVGPVGIRKHRDLEVTERARYRR